MAKKLSPPQRRQLARARAVLVSFFFPYGLPPEGPLSQLLKFWEVSEGVDFHLGKMEARLKRLVRNRALETNLPRPWRLYSRGTKTPMRCAQPPDKFVYRVLKRSRALPVDPAPPKPPKPAATAVPPASKIAPKTWFANALEAYPLQPGEETGDYAKRLHGLMRADAETLTRLWEPRTFNRRLNETVQTARHPARRR